MKFSEQVRFLVESTRIIEPTYTVSKTWNEFSYSVDAKRNVEIPSTPVGTPLSVFRDIYYSMERCIAINNGTAVIQNAHLFNASVSETMCQYIAFALSIQGKTRVRCKKKKQERNELRRRLFQAFTPKPGYPMEYLDELVALGMFVHADSSKRDIQLVLLDKLCKKREKELSDEQHTACSDERRHKQVHQDGQQVYPRSCT